MSELKVVEGGIFEDYRGKIAHVNDLDMTEINRFYIISHDNTEVIRAWHAHQYERKWFYCLKGSFTLALVKIDNWENPSKDLKPEVFHMTASESKMVCVPIGYANGLKADEPNSMMMVYSDKILSEALKDSWRYDKNMWMDW